MASNDQTPDVATYAASVRAALSSLSPEEAEVLLEDLEDHLREVATEVGGPLVERLGPPEQYARELRAAYGAAHVSSMRRDPFFRDATVAIGWVANAAWDRQRHAFVPGLRPTRRGLPAFVS